MDNKKNLVDIPKEIRKKLKFVFVDRMEEVLKVALKGKRRKR
jgi:ATP-dependent Lon protease